MKNIKVFFLSIICFFVLFSCAQQDNTLIPVESIKFSKETVSINVSQSAAVPIELTPDNCNFEMEKLTFEITPNDLCTISNVDKSGCILTGQKRGSGVLTVSYENFKDYLQIDVTDAVASKYTYISLPEVDLKMQKGARRSVVANLVGASQDDIDSFKWESSDKSVVSVEYSGSTAVLTANKYGSAVITVSNSASLYPAKMLAIVPEKEGDYLYLTTDDNVINLIQGEVKDFSVSIIGGSDNDYSSIYYRIKEGEEYFSISGSGEKCSINPKEEGQGIIEVIHLKSTVPLIIQVNITTSSINDAIMCDSDFLYFDNEEKKEVNLSLASGLGGKWSFEKNDEDIIDVILYNNKLVIVPLKMGDSIIKVYNTLISDVKEIKVCVDNIFLKKENYSIRCSQNVIKMSEGEMNIPLEIELLGGNENDKSGFLWTVSDSSVINLECVDGKVVYSKNAVSNEEIKVSGLAYINAVACGHSSIVISHPKCEYTCTVDVIVYPKGSLNNNFIEVSGKNYIEVVNDSEYIYTFNENVNYSSFTYSVSEENVILVSVENNCFIIKALKSGCVLLTFYSEILKTPFSVNVVCGSEDEFKNKNLLKADISSLKGYKDNVYYFSLVGDFSEGIGNVSLAVEDNNICNVSNIQEIICVEFKQQGSTVLQIKVEGFDNVIYIPLYCLIKETSLKYPYVFYSDSFVSLNCEKEISIPLVLSGSSDDEYNSISFDYDEKDLSLDFDGKNLKMKGLKEGRGVIKVSHPKVYETKEITYIVYNTYSESQTKLSIWTDKSNFIGNKGEKILVKINSSDNLEHEYSCEVSDINIVDCIIDNNYLLLNLKEYGKTSVYVRTDGAFDVCINVNVVSDVVTQPDSYFNVPVIVRGIVNSTFEIKTDYTSEYNNYISNIKWIYPDSFKFTQNHGCANFIASEKGIFEIYVEIEELGIKKKSLVYIYKDNEELNNSNSVYLENFSYNLMEGESIELKAKLFSTWKQEEIISKLEWKVVEGSFNVDISFNGVNCSVNALKEGLSKIVISNIEYNISFEFIIYVAKKANEAFYNFSMQRMILVKPSEIKNISYLLEGSVSSDDYNGVNILCDSSFIDLKINGKTISVFVQKEGDYYCTLKKNGWNDFNFLICCRNDIDTEVSYLFSSEKIKIINAGTSSPLYFYSNNNSKIKYSIQGNDCIEIENNTEYINIKGLKEGECTLFAEFEGLVCAVNISVQYNNFSFVSELKVPQFVYIKKGIDTDVSVWCDSSVFFESLDICLSILPSGNSVKLSSDFCGVYELKVSVTENNYKIIKVIVYEKEEELNDIKLINIPQRIFEVRKGKTIFIDTLITGNDFDNISYIESSKDFADLKLDNGILTVNAKEEGTFTVKFRYQQDYITIMINVKGINDYIYNENEFSQIAYYLYSDKTYSFIKTGSTETFTAYLSSLDGNYFNSDTDYIWTVQDSSIINIITSDNICSVKGLKKGKTQLYCSSSSAANTLIFNIEVGTDYDLFEANNHFIHVKNIVVYHDMNTEYTSFEGTAYNLSKEELNKLYTKVDNSEILSVSSVVNDDKILFTVRGKKCGKALITIGTPGCDFTTKVTVIVSHTIKGSSVYLTTTQNYSVVRTGETLSVGVNLKNYEELNSGNYKWNKVSGANCITVIGNGNNIQVYGVNEGMCQLRCTHLPTNSTIDLYVLVSNSEKTIKYLTCDSLIIDTNVTSVMNSFICNIIGGEDKDNNSFKFTVDNSDVVSVVSSGNIFYYRGLKEGTANLHISNEDSGCINSLDIVFNVKDSITTSYMKPNVSSVYLKKNDSSTSVSVSFGNCSNIDDNLIDWFIYSQSLNSGNVVSIISSGSKCVIKPENNGYATIRANYEPLGLSCTIGVYVDNIGKISFYDKEIKVAKGESVFASLVLPEYLDDIANYVTFKSLDESMCSAFGTGRVCCIESIKEGSCIVRAYNSLDESYCDLGVTIIEEKAENPKIILNKNTLVLNPRSENQILYAYLSGANLTGFEGNDIKWKIKSDSTGCLSLFPDTGEEIYLRLNPCDNTQDSDYGKVKCGQAVIEVSHSLSEITKTIYVTIQEQSNFFSLDNYSINLEVSNSKNIKCKIVNGKVKDYENVKWAVSGFNTDKYGNKVNVIKLLNDSGEDCSIYALNEGVCTLTAFYFGTSVSCEVNVTSARTFKISGSTSLQMIPDAVEDNYIDVPYVLRPANTVPLWNVQNVNTTSDVNIVSVEAMEGKNCIRIRPLGSEGQAKILGTAVGVGQVTVNVTVKFNPKIELMEEDVSSVRIQMSDSDEAKNIVRYKFSSYPSIYYVKPVVSGTNASSFNVFIESTEIVNGKMEGNLVIQALKECPDSSALVTLQQYSDSNFENRVDKKESKVEIYVGARYPVHKLMFGFKRGAGGFSFRNSLNALHKVDEEFIDSDSGKYFKLWESGDNTTDLELADGEQHYFIIKDINKNSYTKIDRVEILKNNTPQIITNNIKNQLSDKYKDDFENFIKKELFNISPVKIEHQEETQEGSYIFDVLVGNKTDGKISKYGRDWFALSKNSPYPCSVFASTYVEFYEPEIKIDGNYITLSNTGVKKDFIENDAEYFVNRNVNYIYNWKGTSYIYKDNFESKIHIIDNIKRQTNIMNTRNVYRKDIVGHRYTRFLTYAELQEKGNECATKLLELSNIKKSQVKTLYRSQPITESRLLIKMEPNDVKGERHAKVSWAEDAYDDERGELRSASFGSKILRATKNVGHYTITGDRGGTYYHWGDPPYHQETVQEIKKGEVEVVPCTFTKTKYTYNIEDLKNKEKSFYLLTYTFEGENHYRVISFNEKGENTFNSSETYCLRFLPIDDKVYYMGSKDTEKAKVALVYQTLYLDSSNDWGRSFSPYYETETVTDTLDKIHFHTQVKFDIFPDGKNDDDVPGPDEGYPEVFPINADTEIKLNYPNLSGINYKLSDFYNDGTYDIYKTNNFNTSTKNVDSLGIFCIPTHNVSACKIETSYTKLTHADFSKLKNGQSYLEEERFNYLTKNNQNLGIGFKYFYDKKTDYDFKIYYGDIKVTYTDISGERKTIFFPLYINYYNNDADYYIYDEDSGSVTVNENYKGRTEAISFFGRKYERTNPEM